MPTQINDWETATIDVGSVYRLVYLFLPKSGVTLTSGELKQFRTVLDQRPGVQIIGVQALGTGVVQADVRFQYMDTRLGAQAGHRVYTDGATYQLENVFLMEGAPLLADVGEPLARATEWVENKAGRLLGQSADIVEDVRRESAPWLLILIAALVGFLAIKTLT